MMGRVSGTTTKSNPCTGGLGRSPQIVGLIDISAAEMWRWAKVRMDMYPDELACRFDTRGTT